jgi:hypothetical protein
MKKEAYVSVNDSPPLGHPDQFAKLK